MLLKRERIEVKAVGKMEGILDLLEDLGEVPDDLRVMIEEETSLSKLRSWLKAAAKAESIHQFMEQMQ